MTNFIVSYDLNGARPSHKEVDQLLEQLGATRGRVLETVWYVGFWGTEQQLFDAIRSKLGREDRLIVVRASEAQWENPLLSDDSLATAWRKHR